MSAPPHDPKIERILLQTVPWEARKEGGNVLQDCLRDLWAKAVSIGFNHGEENLARAREEGFIEGKEAGLKDGMESGRESQEAVEAVVLPASTSEKRTVLSKEDSELIAELCSAVRAAKALEWLDGGNGLEEAISKLWETAAGVGFQCGRSKASVILSSPPRRSVAVAATQTDEVAASAAAPAPAPAVPRLDWAEDAAALPVVPSHSASPPVTPRDFSALCTGSPQPFASLQRRRRRPPTSTLNHSAHRRKPQQKNVFYCSTGRRAPLPYSHRPPSIPFPAPTSLPPSDALDWDQDPRLRDLGQALAALGWVRL
ncbi:hypothetical protein DFH06DRAFT_1250180 [Mycena polygramma]|nr:hypothetical protein DFH06DRAFT_1250180 [Mycena polygramma]